MKVIIQGHEYDFDSLGTMTLFDSLELQKQTGMSVQEFADRGQLLAAAAAEAEAAEVQLEPDGDMLLLLAIMIWLVRRRAGERLTLEQATDFPMSDLQIIPDEASPADPPVPGPAGDPDAGAPAPGSPQTSSPMSAPA